MTYKKYQERTLVIIKPDGIQRSLIGEIISRFEKIGLKVVGMKMMTPTPDLIEKHYTLDPSWKMKVGEKSIKAYHEKGLMPPSENPLDLTEVILKKLIEYMTAGPVIAIALEGAHAVKIVRKIIGGTEPLTSDVGTIRGDYVLDSYELSDVCGRSVRNLVHASGSVKEAEDELKHWFSKDEIIEYKHVNEKIMYECW